MQRNELVEYYPATGHVDTEIKVENVSSTLNDKVITAMAIIPPSKALKKIVIHQLAWESGEVEYRAISAQCPHQGVDISADELKTDGNIYCSVHKRPICIFSEYNRAYRVEKREESFFIVNSLKQ